MPITEYLPWVHRVNAMKLFPSSKSYLPNREIIAIMFKGTWVSKKGIRPPVHTGTCHFFMGIALGVIFLKIHVVSIEDRNSRSFASHCSDLLRLLWRFSLGTWISLIMIAASWWLDIRLPAYSTVLPSAIWIHSVLLLRTTSLRTGPLWAIDSSLFKWAEAISSQATFVEAARILSELGIALCWSCSLIVPCLWSSRC